MMTSIAPYMMTWSNHFNNYFSKDLVYEIQKQCLIRFSRKGKMSENDSPNHLVQMLSIVMPGHYTLLQELSMIPQVLGTT